MSHHHHHQKRQKNLAWFGLVMAAVIAVFVGLVMWSGSQAVVPTHSVTQIIPDEPVQVQTSPDYPPNYSPPSWLNPPTIPGYNGNGQVIGIPNPDRPRKVRHAQKHHRDHHWNHCRVHRHDPRRIDVPSHRNVLPDRNQVRHSKSKRFCEPKTIPGYSHGSVVAIPNPDCK